MKSLPALGSETASLRESDRNNKTGLLGGAGHGPEALQRGEAWGKLLGDTAPTRLALSRCRSLGPGDAGWGRGARQLLRKWQAGERGSPVIIKEQRCRGAGARAGLWGRLANGSLEKR